jgi:hypothetical protein
MATAATKPTYAGAVAIKKTIDAARKAGLDVGGIEVAPDGTIRIMEARAMPKPAENLFDQLEAEGKL